MIENVHFRSTMDVSPRTAGSGLSDLIGEITGWIRAKEGPEARFLAESGWALRPGNWRKRDGKAFVDVDAISEAAGTQPELWAMRYSHQDSEFAARRWTIDFGIVQSGPSQWRLSLTVGNSLHQTFMGREPGRLPVTPPRFIKTLVASERWRCSAGSVSFACEPFSVHVGSGHKLRDTVTDRQRGCPIVYVSRDRSTGDPLVDPMRLAQSIVGSGVVWVAATPELDEELEYLIPFEYRAPNGMVRVYAPGADLSSATGAFRHRFFTRSQIEQFGAAEIEQQIAQSLTRRQGWVSVRSSVGSIDDIAVRRREARRAILQERTDTAARDELLQLYQADNLALSQQVAAFEQERDAAQQLLDESQSELDSARDRLRVAEYERETFRQAEVEARRETSGLREAVDSVRNLRQLPRSLSDAIDLIERLHAGAVVFTDQAKQSAKRASLDSVAEAWGCLFAVATALPRLAFQDNQSSGTLPQRFESETGYELTLTEGKTTNADSTLASARRIHFDGQEWDISAHVKLGNRAPKLLRVHFALDRELQRVIVGHCGDHLTTAGTRRRH